MFEEALKCRPEQYGFRSTEWTAALLREYVHTKAGILLSENTIRNQVHLLGYTWKRPRYILEPDPDQEKKKANSQENTEFAASIRSFI
jgi:transposase